MAADGDPSVAADAPAKQHGEAADNAQPATAAEPPAGDADDHRHGNNDGGDAATKNDDGRPPRKRGDVGRAERKREAKESKKRKKQDDWREWKRRKTAASSSTADGEPKNPFSREEIAAEERRPKRKVAVMIGYSGTGYKGMQVNGDEPTIERDLFRAFIDAKAISKANADDPRKSSLARCARTDKGVHAAGNVISLKLIIEDTDIVERINAHLPEQIRVWGIQRTNNSFNCYQYCDSRWYEYLMPSYCLLPPHPQTFLGKKLAELAREHGADAEAEVAALMADVASFWADVEDGEVKPILAALDSDTRAQVLERLHVPEDQADDGAKPDADDGSKPALDNGSMPDAGALPARAADAAKPTLPSHKPKHRELGPVDLALRDIKSAYVTAKRRYRVGPERLQRLQAALDKYVGTNNFHNYTVQKSFSDASAKRHIKSFVVNPQPVIIGDTEWLSLKVHGQSFMMHQIRKMVGMVSLLVRCGTDLGRVTESYGNRKIAIPKAPGLGLLLERPVFENYNRRATETLDRPEIDFARYEEPLEAFKKKHIYTRIFDVEERENTFHAFFNQIDQFRSNHFLWLTAGGISVAEISKGEAKVQEDVDKELGDEDEDPEGGEG